MSVNGEATTNHNDLELELRLLPGVVSVGSVPTASNGSAGITVVASNAEPSLEESVRHIAHLYSLDVPVHVVDLTRSGAGREQQRLIGRVALTEVEFDSRTGTAEVHLTYRERSGTGRSNSGPLAGAAEATLAALADMGISAPFYLMTSNRFGSEPDAPTIVVLRPRGGGHDRIGVALAAIEAEAASRATLCALNRYLNLEGAAQAT